MTKRNYSRSEAGRPFPSRQRGGKRRGIFSTLWLLPILLFNLPSRSLGDAFQRDDNGRLTAVSFAAGGSITYAYDPAGNITRIVIDSGDGGGGGGGGESPDLLNGVLLGDNFYFNDWYGIYNITFSPWLFHVEHGWQYVFPTEFATQYFFYDLESQDFWWTDTTFPPFTFYSFNRGTFNFFFVGTTNPRQFVDLETEVFWTIP